MRNLQTREVIRGLSIDILGLDLPDVRRIARGGSTNVVVRGLGPTNFDRNTRVDFGSGIRVESVTVQSKSRLTARLTSVRSAAPGARTVSVKTQTQTLVLSGVFSVDGPPPTNLAPVVSAGSAQTITLPSGATLSGTVTDDGLPQGAAVTSTWTQQSGPGTATFANPASPATTATFSVAGTYVLRLTASDTALSASADVTITVNAAPPPPPTNLAPVVSAGSAQTITLPAGA
ncbi:MAG: hypothetical protein ABL982_18355, partial [Vicinamibacterales bacterium]